MNEPDELVLLRPFPQFANTPALVCAERSLTWSEADRRLRQAVAAITRLPLRPSQRVAVFAPNEIETVLAYVAVLLAGRSAVPANFHLTAAELTYILDDSDTGAVLAGPETVDRARDAAAAAAHDIEVIAWRCDPPAGVTSWEEALDGCAPTAPDLTVMPRPHLFYTSGTTGRPKGVEAPPGMFEGGDSMAEHLDSLRAAGERRPHRHLAVGPLYHGGPFSAVRLFAGGVSVVLLPRFEPENCLAAIDEHKIGSTFMVPTHFQRLLALPDEVKRRYSVSSLEQITHSGAPCPIPVKRAMLEWWGPIIHEGYGSTEVSGTCHITPQEWLEHPGSVGRPVPPFEVLVVDDEGNEVATGNEGRLFFRDGTGRGLIYRNDPDKTAAAHLAPGVFTIGEMGYVDADGYVYITDRFSDMVVSGGANIYPAEAEQVLIEHPAVADVACIGVPDDDMGEQLRAVVVPTAGTEVDAADVIAWCRDRLTHYKCPRSVVFTDDLGRTAMGKLDKRGLRNRWAGVAGHTSSTGSASSASTS